MPSSPADVPKSADQIRTSPLFAVLEDIPLRRILILASIYLIPAIIALQPVVSDNDIWWHLQAGKWIVEHAAIPVSDPFSVYGGEKTWVAYSWLFELTMFSFIKAVGESGILLYTLVFTWLIMLVMHRFIIRRCNDFVLSTVLLALVIGGMSQVIVPRTWLVTVLFFAITLEFVLSLREGRISRWFWCLPLIYLLWANVHVQFVYGLALLGLACAAPLIDRAVPSLFRQNATMVWGGKAYQRLVVVTIACVIATLMTPYHVKLYSVVIELSMQSGMWEYIQEMQAMQFRSAGDWLLLSLFSLALVMLGRKAAWSSFELILLFAAAFCGFRGQRDSWLLGLVCLSTVLCSFSIVSEKERGIFGPKISISSGIVVVGGVLLIVVFQNVSNATIQKNTAKLYPIEAAAFVEKQGYQGPIYNHANWGGYLIWRLPQFKVSMDGRVNIYGDERVKRSLQTWMGRPTWQEDEDLEKAGIVIADREFPLVGILRMSSQFREVYQDEVAVVFVRNFDGS